MLRDITITCFSALAIIDSHFNEWLSKEGANYDDLAKAILNDATDILESLTGISEQYTNESVGWSMLCTTTLAFQSLVLAYNEDLSPNGIFDAFNVFKECSKISNLLNMIRDFV